MNSNSNLPGNKTRHFFLILLNWEAIIKMGKSKLKITATGKSVLPKVKMLKSQTLP